MATKFVVDYPELTVGLIGLLFSGLFLLGGIAIRTMTKRVTVHINKEEGELWPKFEERFDRLENRMTALENKMPNGKLNTIEGLLNQLVARTR